MKPNFYYEAGIALKKKNWATFLVKFLYSAPRGFGTNLLTGFRKKGVIGEGGICQLFK